MTTKRKVMAAATLFGLGVLGRLLPHFPNATPVNAVAFGARRTLGGWWSIVIPLSAMLATDLVIGFYDWRVMASVYASFALIAALGTRIKGSVGVMLSLTAANAGFFLLTNGVVWLSSPWYPKTFSGLIDCYTLGLPFALSMLAGDLLYTGALLGCVARGAYTKKFIATARQAFRRVWAVNVQWFF